MSKTIKVEGDGPADEGRCLNGHDLGYEQTVVIVDKRNEEITLGMHDGHRRRRARRPASAIIAMSTSSLGRSVRLPPFARRAAARRNQPEGHACASSGTLSTPLHRSLSVFLWKEGLRK